MLPFPRWKGERTTRTAHAPWWIVLHGLHEARVVGCPLKPLHDAALRWSEREEGRRRRGDAAGGDAGGNDGTNRDDRVVSGDLALTLCGEDSGACRRSAHWRDQRRRGGDPLGGATGPE